ncbi:hypothetical protein [Deinococcus depolymerans]|uniref:Uncharacterized protein n=1 Tax=Deinococcus depolymerans TaxID=392408 RepID=A0ABN1BYU8_9DEIO
MRSDVGCGLLAFALLTSGTGAWWISRENVGRPARQAQAVEARCAAAIKERLGVVTLRGDAAPIKTGDGWTWMTTATGTDTNRVFCLIRGEDAAPQLVVGDAAGKIGP